MLMLRFEIRPVKGEWSRLTTDAAPMSAVVPGPDVDVEVEISVRNDEKSDARWVFSLTDSDNPIALVAEDLTETSK